MAHDVFISYSSKDKTTADAVCAILERDGIRCWIAPRDVVAGHDWAESIIQAIHGSKAFVLLFSGFSNTSGQIKREVERAADREIPIIPFRLDDIAPNESLEFFISSPHWMDAFTPPLEGHIKRLSSTILQLLAQSDPSRAPAPGLEPAQSPPPAAAAPSAPTQPAAKPAIGSLAPWLIVAGLAVVILIGAVVLLRGHGAPPAPAQAAASGVPAPSAQAAAVSAAPSPPAGQAAVSAAPTPPAQQVAAIAPLPPAAPTPRAAAGSATCVVADPTPTPLNVRTTPNGKIAQTLSNGAAVHAVKQVEAGGQTWSLIGTGRSGPILGWVFTSYIVCGT